MRILFRHWNLNNYSYDYANYVQKYRGEYRMCCIYCVLLPYQHVLCSLCIAPLSTCVVFIVYCALINMCCVYCVLRPYQHVLCLLCIAPLSTCVVFIVYCALISMCCVYCVLRPYQHEAQ